MNEQQGETLESREDAAMPAELCDRLTAAVPALRRFALSLTKDREEALDLVQETCLRALAFWHQWRSESNFESWLFQITRNLWIDRIRSRKSRERTIETVQQIGSGYVDGQRVMEHRLTLGSIRELLPRLPQEQQDILLNVAMEGLSYKEASARLSTPIGTVMSRLSRARRALHSELGGSLSAGLIMALLLPFLDREARAEVKDLGTLSGDLEGPLANGLLMAPLLPLLGRGGSSGAPRATEILGKALSAITKEMGGGVRGLQRADVAASLFFLLLADMALTDQAGYQQLRDLFERALGDPGNDRNDLTQLALEDGPAGAEDAWSHPQENHPSMASRTGGNHVPGGTLLVEQAQDPDHQQLQAAEALADIEQAPVGPAERQIADASPGAVPPTDTALAEQTSGETLKAPATDGLGRNGEIADPQEQLLATAPLEAGVPSYLGTTATGPGNFATLAQTPIPVSEQPVAPADHEAADSLMAFVLGERVELDDGESQDRWASLLGELLNGDDGEEDILFEAGEGTLPVPDHWDVANSGELNEAPITIGELIDIATETPALDRQVDTAGETAPQEDLAVEPQSAQQMLAQSEPFDLSTVNDVQTDVS